MTSRFTVRRLAALVLTAAIVATAACSSDDATNDDPPLFSADVPAAAPTGPAVPPTPPPAATRPAPAPPPAEEPAPAPPREPAPASGQETRAPSAPTDYSEVGPDYAAAQASLRATGREIVDALLSGETGGPYARFSDELKGRLPEHELQAILQELPGDRVHFRVQIADEDGETNAVFDGRLSDGTISGGFTLFAEAPGTFSLERRSAAEPAAPLVGRWEGTLLIGEAQIGSISVAFERQGEEFRGTIEDPEGGLPEVALEDVRYEPAVDVGQLLAESVLPFSPDLRVYTSEHAWGPSTLVVALTFDASGTIINIDDLRWRAPLPLDPAKDFRSETEFRLPFDGIWLVGAGGPTELQGHHLAAPAQRHASDIFIWKQGATHRGDGSRNEDYWAWGEPVLAPADGTIVAFLDGLEDNTPGVLKPEPHPGGNHVVLKTAAGEFLHISHLQQGSIQVKEGEQVPAGAVLALTGNSGNSSEPHIHIHLQDEQDFFSPTASGLPLSFTSYRANGEPVSEGSPVQGQLIQHAEG